MPMRPCTTRLALVAVLILPLASCQTMGHSVFTDANALYQRGDYEGAAVLYEDALQSDPDLVVAHFYLANSYDNQFRPGVRGDADDDRLLQLAIQEYIVAIDQETDIARRTLAMQHLGLRI